MLIAGAQKEQEQAELEVRFAEAVRAVERGDTNPLSPDDWERIRRRGLGQPQPPVANP